MHQYCIYIYALDILMYIIIISYINHNYICEYVWLALKFGGLFDKLSVYFTPNKLG